MLSCKYSSNYFSCISIKLADALAEQVAVQEPHSVEGDTAGQPDILKIPKTLIAKATTTMKSSPTTKATPATKPTQSSSDK